MSCHVVILATAGATYRLSDLIALYDTEPDPSPTMQTVAREVHVQAHPDNTGKVYGGEDALVSLLRYSCVLTPTSGPRVYQLNHLSTSTLTKYFVADANGQRLMVELVN